MNDTDEIRAALSDALRLPGEVQARPGAATTIRARARLRRRTTAVTFAVAAPACLVVVALLAGTIGPSDSSVSPPASTGTAAPRPSASATIVAISPGPRQLMSPIEIRPVLQEYLICPPDGQTIPAAVGPHCYRLGPAALVIHRLRDLSQGLSQVANGSVGDQYALNMTMTAHDAAAFADLTAALLNKQVAFVVGGQVWTAPTIAGHITEGRIQIPVDAAGAQALVTAFGG